jgi:hypothetical protein
MALLPRASPDLRVNAPISDRPVTSGNLCRQDIHTTMKTADRCRAFEHLRCLGPISFEWRVTFVKKSLF